MKGFNFTWKIILFMGVLLLTACSTALAETPEIAVTPTIEDDTEPTETAAAVQEGEIKQVETPIPEPTSTPTVTDAPIEHIEASCEDPFEGVFIRFRTTGWETNFCEHSVPLSEFDSGGPPRDGIPPIDNPQFISVDSADSWLEDQEPVIGLELNDQTRAYPLQILVWHEIVNDTVGDVPVVVTFCPLCNTALVFKRPSIDGEILTFGTTGNLRNSDLVMWDRQTESWWQQFTGEALVGDLTGTQLEFIPTAILSWRDFKGNYPDGEVLSRDTGFSRTYGSNPYPGYDSVDRFPFLFSGEVDDRFLPMARVTGILLDGNSTVYANNQLKEELVVNDTLSEHEIVVFWKAGTASSLDASSIPDGRDVGATGVFFRTIDDMVLTFTANGDGTFRDDETGSIWDILGSAVDGPLAGKSLKSVPHHDTFWFAWSAFVPDGSLAE